MPPQRFPVRGHLFGGGCPYDDPVGTGRPHADGCPRVLPASVPSPVYSAWVARSSELFASGAAMTNAPSLPRSIFVMTAVERAQHRRTSEPAADAAHTSLTPGAETPAAILHAVDAIVAALLERDLPPVAPAQIDLAVTCVIERIGEMEVTVGPKIIAELAAAAPDLAYEAIFASTRSALPAARQETPEALSAVRRELYERIPGEVDAAIDRRLRS